MKSKAKLQKLRNSARKPEMTRKTEAERQALEKAVEFTGSDDGESDT